MIRCVLPSNISKTRSSLSAWHVWHQLWHFDLFCGSVSTPFHSLHRFPPLDVRLIEDISRSLGPQNQSRRTKHFWPFHGKMINWQESRSTSRTNLQSQRSFPRQPISRILTTLFNICCSDHMLDKQCRGVWKGVQGRVARRISYRRRCISQQPGTQKPAFPTSGGLNSGIWRLKKYQSGFLVAAEYWYVNVCEWR